jgi:hypothetical protein
VNSPEFNVMIMKYRNGTRNHRNRNRYLYQYLVGNPDLSNSSQCRGLICRFSEKLFIEVPGTGTLFEYLFARLIASHRGDPSSIPGRDMSVSGPLGREYRIEDGDDINFDIW